MTEPTRLEELIKLLDTKQVKRDTLESARVEACRQRDSLDAEMISLRNELLTARKGRVYATDKHLSKRHTYYVVDGRGYIDSWHGTDAGFIKMGNFFYDEESAREARAALIEQYKAKES